MEEYPRVLVIAHNPFSDTQNNGKTLSSFFKGWPKQNIAQLYLTLDKYDTSVCEKFFRFSDLEVLKGLKNSKNIGKAFYKDDNKEDNEKEEAHKSKIYIFIRNLFLKRSPLLYCARNIIWNIVKPWKKENLKIWLDEFKPEVIFFQSSNVYKIFDMVEDIRKEYNIPLIMETTDDYVTAKFSISPFFWVNYFKLLKRYKMAVNNSECVFAIGDMMAEEYTKRFRGKFKVAMNSIEIDNKVIPYKKVKNEKVVLTYAGNLGLNRWRVLSKIGKTIASIKREDGIDAMLEIYSLNKPKDSILKKLTIPGVMSFNGSLTSEELIDKRNKSDILVHVESFDRKNKYITRLSVSTKIPEYLLSERCILAVGPKDVASIKYIQDNKMGKVITELNREVLKDNLTKIIKDRAERELYIENGIKIAEKNHSFEKNKELVQNEIKMYYNYS